MDRWAKGDPSGYMDILAPDVTIFTPDLDRRLDGRAAAVALYEQVRGKVSIPRYEFVNPLVQTFGDGAAAQCMTINSTALALSGHSIPRWRHDNVAAESRGTAGAGLPPHR